MTRLAVSAPLDLEDRIVAAAGEHGDIVVLRAGAAVELIARLDQASVDLAIVDASAEHLDAHLVRTCDAAGIRILALTSDGDGEARSRRLGVTWRRASTPYLELRSAFSEGDAAAQARSRGTVCVVWGPAGSPGRTTTAIAVASELLEEGRRVAIVDADTHAPSVAPALGLLDEAPGIAAAARLAKTGRLTVEDFERIAQRVAVGRETMHVITGLAGARRWPELTAESVAKVLDACRDWVDVVIVDVAASLESDEELSSDLFAPRRNAATFAALQAADRVVAVACGDAIGMTRLLRAYPDLLEFVAPERVRVVMNRVRATAMGLAPEVQIAQTLRRFGAIECAAFLPDDQRSADRALLEGTTLRMTAARSRLRRAFAAKAGILLLDAPELGASQAPLRRPRVRARPLRSMLGAFFATLVPRGSRY